LEIDHEQWKNLHYFCLSVTRRAVEWSWQPLESDMETAGVWLICWKPVESWKKRRGVVCYVIILHHYIIFCHNWVSNFSFIMSSISLNTMIYFLTMKLTSISLSQRCGKEEYSVHVWRSYQDLLWSSLVPICRSYPWSTWYPKHLLLHNLC